MKEQEFPPTRWRDPSSGASDEIRALLSAAGATHGIPDAHAAELRSFVMGLSAIPVLPWWKSALLPRLALVTAMTAGSAAVLHARRAPTPAVSTTLARAPGRPSVAPRSPRAPDARPGLPETTEEPAAPAVVPSLARATPAALPVRWLPSHAPPALAASHAPAAETVVAPVGMGPSGLGSSALTPTDPPAQASPDDARFLEGCRRDIARGQIDAALDALATHAREHPSSSLSEERDYLRVRALYVGRRPTFRDEASRYLRTRGDGLYASRVEAMLHDGAP